MKKRLLIVLLAAVLSEGCHAEQVIPAASILSEQTGIPEETSESAADASVSPESTIALAEMADPASIPAYAGEASAIVHDDVPYFTQTELSEETPELFSELDELGRAGAAMERLGPETLPSEPRGSIGMIRPSGWHLVKYDIVDGQYLYNRCHLIAYELSGVNAEERNLITGTRYLNVSGMLPYENKTADYIRSSGYHVLYRVTPVYEGDNLVASGVLMEAESIEDEGAGLSFCVYCYNVQPGVVIDYSDGSSHLEEEPEESAEPVMNYVLNTNTHRFHYPWCDSVSEMKDKNREEYTGLRSTLIAEGYVPCGRCNP